ncbi:Kinesin-like protein KIN-7L [Vanrija pseudolonga]|uniref:Kinesin-like protein KIN-7L n=1 Tax=Vanrija pseudolonga TaxID=143232 RepID=A0AAF0YB33_9TREE|nr:Kinesin-like protein KIN-7L [Vanrija pseudolonga]
MAPKLTPSSSTSSFERSNSSPSLARVGLEHRLPSTGLMAPATPEPRRASLKRAREAATTPARTGEIESNASGADSDDEVLSVVRSSRARAAKTPRVKDAVATPTPKRKIVNAIDVVPPRSTKKPSLQDRLNAAAAKTTTRTSTPVAARVSAVPPVPRLSTLATGSSVGTPSRSYDNERSDKVVVCVRIKPTSNPFATTAYDLSPTSLTLSDTHPNVIRRGGKAGREAEYTYMFDTLINYPTRTPELYDAKVAPMVQKAMNGFNSTVFAYGQTGSGKSHTMSGTRSELGIIPCAIDGIFDAITADCDRAFLLRVSYIEIYNETLRDLLNNKPGNLPENEKPTIHTNKGKVYVEPLVEAIVSTPQDVVDLLERGNINRKTGATDWVCQADFRGEEEADLSQNERSSRSHAVFTIVIESRPRDGDGHDEVRVSRLTLIVSAPHEDVPNMPQDLAGSEKAVSDVERRGEGKHINQSLLALREVVHKLTEKGKRGHVPYRNSKLTHLLENVLGGDSNICVICTMSADEAHCAETLETLKFAGRCSQVETKAQKNILLNSDLAVIRAKDIEIAELRRQLEQLAASHEPQRPTEEIAEVCLLSSYIQCSPNAHQLAESVASMEARKVKLTEQLAKLNGEILTSELPRTMTGLPTSPPRKKRPRISDFTSLTSAALGIGLGTPTKTPVVDRRAVSTMVRVVEDSETDAQSAIIENLDPAKRFEDDVTIASLRRTLATKETEIEKQTELLEAASADAAELPGVKSRLEELKSTLATVQEDHTTQLHDAQRELESTRAELARTVADKAAQIEALETSVLDLRKSREELVIEDQQHLDKEREKHAAELEKLREQHKGEITNIKTAIRTLRGQADEHASRVTTLEASNADLSKSLATVEKDRDSAMSDHAIARRDAEKAASDLDSFQKAAIGRESEVVAGLRKEVSAEREARDATEKSLVDEREARSSAEAQLKKEQESRKALVVDLDQLRASSAKTDADLKEAQSSHEKIKSDREEAQKQTEALEAALKKANDRFGATEKEKSAVEARLAEEVKAKEAALASAKEAASTSEAIRKELADKLSSVTTERDQHLATSKQLTDEAAKVQQQLDDAKRAHSDVTRDVEALRAGASVADSVRADLDNHRSLLAKEQEAKKVLADDHSKVTAQVDTVTKELDRMKSALQTEKTAHAETSAKLAEALQRIAELEKELGSAKAATSELSTKFESTQASALAADKAHSAATASSVEKHKAEVESVRKEVEAEKKARVDAEAQLKDLKSASTTAAGEVAKQLAEARAALDESKRANADLASALDSQKKAHETAAGSTAESHATLVKDLRAKFEQEKGLRSTAEAEVKTAAATHSKALEEVSTALAAEKALRATAEANAKKIAATSEGSASQLQATGAELSKIQAELETLASTLASEQARTTEAEATIVQLRAQIALLQKDLDLKQTELAAIQARSDRLAAELVTVSATAQPARVLRRSNAVSSTSVPSGLSLAASNALRGTGGMAGNSAAPDVAGWKRSHEIEEIGRLDKVVESQKAMIEEQRVKIKFWADELQKQQEIVRLLTQESSASPGKLSVPLPQEPKAVDVGPSRAPETAPTKTPTKTPTRPGHVRNALSMFDSPGTPVAPLRGATLARSHIPPTFTAKNLSLPSLPTPLPMHSGQQSNALRKTRRITIDHDMNRLEENSRVNQIKGVFDSPTKEEAGKSNENRTSSRTGSSRTQVDIPRRRF